MGLDGNQSTDLAKYWFVFLAHLRIIASATGVFFIISVFHFFSLPNIYTATTTILAEQTETPPSRQEMLKTTTSTDVDEYYGTQLAILRGLKIEKMVKAELGGDSEGYAISASHIRDTRILSLSVTHLKPELAAKIANKFAEIYVRESKHENAFIGQQILQLLPGSPEAVLPGGSAVVSQGFSKQEFASSLNSVSGDPQVTQLLNEKLGIQSKLTELSQRYGPEHPAIKDLNQRLSTVESDIKARSETILSNVKANLAGEANITNIKVLEEAPVPKNPSGPNRFRGILSWTLIGFCASASLISFFEYANQKVRTKNDVISLGICFLGYIPLVKEFLKGQKYHEFSEEPDLVRVLKANATLADAVANARTHILFSMPYEKSRRIMLTSAIPDEGKSTVAALLAVSLTTLGRKILLVDGDLRKPSLHNYLGFRNDKGLTDYLVGAATIDEIIQPMRNNPLQLITAGSVSRNPSELLASERFRELLDRCGERFDRIVIDVPPVLYIPDGLIVAKIVHTGILICGADMVNKETIQEVKEKFDSIGYSFIGAIINRADFEREGYRYKYYGTYKSYYKPR